MIKNLPLIVLLLAACSTRADGREAFQGVIEHEERALGFEVGGRVIAIPVTRGSKVTQGALLARLDDSLLKPLRDARASDVKAARAELDLLRAGSRPEDVRAAEAQLRASRERVVQLEKQLVRERVLAGRGALGPVRVEELESESLRAQEETRMLEERVRLLRAGARAEEVTAAEARAEGASAMLLAEEQRLARHVLAADQPATVVGVHVEAGEVVAQGTPVVTLADTKRPFVDVLVPQARITEIRTGASASVRVDGLKGTLSGRVEDIGRSTEFTPRYVYSPRERPSLSVRVRVRIDDPQELLRAGIPAFVTIP
ncbi:MAG: HlyD family efflux transporter periplasmic adaptor subunit [Deltaproteobacteria bacterium]|nr:HlyD family efflux transporter periplasmic adaptor subunit [Deltaproteobacteria bacterium]